MFVLVRFKKDLSEPKFVDMDKYLTCLRASKQSYLKRDDRVDYVYKIYRKSFNTIREFVEEYESGDLEELM